MALTKFKHSPLPNPPNVYDAQYVRQLVRVIELYFNQLDSLTPNEAQSYTADEFIGGTFSGTEIIATDITTTALEAVTGQIDRLTSDNIKALYTDTDALRTHAALIETSTVDSVYGGTFYGDGRWLQLPYNQLSSTVSQTAANTYTAYAVTMNTNDFPDGISIVSNSQITFAKKGIYNIAYSIQFKNTNNDLETIDIWLRKGGTDIANSNTRFTIPARKSSSNPSYLVAVTPIMVDLTADNQYVEIMWRVSNTTVTIEALAAVTANPGVTPAIPATPSVIVGITHVSTQFPAVTRTVPLPVFGFGRIGNITVSTP
jgi:hypothetical protein